LTYSCERKIYISTHKIIDEVKQLPELKIDYITFSGRGEPTLSANLADVIKIIKTLRKEKVAILTNSSLINRDDVRKALSLADFVVVKLDAYSQNTLKLINKPLSSIKFDDIYNGIKLFRKEYTKKLALQIMFIDENKEYADRLAELSLAIAPDEVQINTPLRQCEVKPLSCEEIFKIKGYFKGLNVISVYDKEYKNITPISLEDTLIRRGSIHVPCGT
jgi:wyosine [tRNA(Phe)-imidazoG37] synthetase (radical SAM superfamily)